VQEHFIDLIRLAVAVQPGCTNLGVGDLSHSRPMPPITTANTNLGWRPFAHLLIIGEHKAKVNWFLVPRIATKSGLDVPGMYIIFETVYIMVVCSFDRERRTFMATTRSRSHKHFQLDSVKIKRAQKALRAKTETEAIDRALDLAIAEHESNRLTLEASERFVKSGIDIKDVYDRLGG